MSCPLKWTVLYRFWIYFLFCFLFVFSFRSHPSFPSHPLNLNSSALCLAALPCGKSPKNSASRVYDHPMTEDSDPKCYLFPALDRRKRNQERVGFRVEEEQHSHCSTIRQLRRMASSYSQDCGGQDGVELGLASEGSDISHEHPVSHTFDIFL